MKLPVDLWDDQPDPEAAAPVCARTPPSVQVQNMGNTNGISAKTGYKWRERFIREGLAGMEERSRRPHGHADELGEAVVCEIVRLKQAHARWGAAHNFCKVHSTLGCTPAVGAKLTDHTWSVEELIKEATERADSTT